MEQRSDAWFAARAGKFTSSRAADLMSKTKTGPSTSRVNLIALLVAERITGQCVETYKNAAMERGNELEPEARDAYSFTTGNPVEEVGIVICQDLPNTSSSPDGCVGSDGLVEIKCPAAMGKHMSALLEGSHAKEYHWQLQHQLMVTGRSWVDIVSYDPRWPDHLQQAIFRVERDAVAIQAMREEIIKADAEVTEKVKKLYGLGE